LLGLGERAIYIVEEVARFSIGSTGGEEKALFASTNMKSD
jgi:hypothetical protein